MSITATVQLKPNRKMCNDLTKEVSHYTPPVDNTTHGSIRLVLRLVVNSRHESRKCSGHMYIFPRSITRFHEAQSPGECERFASTLTKTMTATARWTGSGLLLQITRAFEEVLVFLVLESLASFLGGPLHHCVGRVCPIHILGAMQTHITRAQT